MRNHVRSKSIFEKSNAEYPEILNKDTFMKTKEKEIHHASSDSFIKNDNETIMKPFISPKNAGQALLFMTERPNILSNQFPTSKKTDSLKATKKKFERPISAALQSKS
jgi:hypothetical protein